MRFVLLYVKTMSQRESALAERERMFQDQGERDKIGSLVEGWIDTHFEQKVTCLVCGEQAVVSPDADNDMVVFVTKDGGAITMCEECAEAFAYATVTTIDTQAAHELIGRLTVEFIERAQESVSEHVNRSVGNIIVTEKVARLVESDYATEEKKRLFDEKQALTKTPKFAPSNAFKRAVAGLDHE